MALVHVAWLALATSTQFMNGVYPVVLRYLQTCTPHPLTSLQLSLLISLLALPALTLGTLVPLAVKACKKAGWRRKPAGAEEEEQGGLAPLEAPLLPLPPAPQPKTRQLGKQVLLLVGTTLSLNALLMTQAFSLLFTKAYLSQMIFLLSPVFVALLAKAFFRSTLPPGLWPALTLMLAGAAIVIYSKTVAAASPGPANALWAGVMASGEWSGGNWTNEGNFDVPGLLLGGASTGQAGFGWRDAIGMLLSLGSALALASFLLLMQRSRGLVSNSAVLCCNFTAQALLSLGLTYTLQHDRWHVLFELTPREWAVIAGSATFFNYCMNLCQQILVRALGAPEAAAFLPVRLIGSLVAGWPLLSERLDSGLEASGAGLLLLALTWYLLKQKRAAEAALAARMEAEAVPQEP